MKSADDTPTLSTAVAEMGRGERPPPLARGEPFAALHVSEIPFEPGLLLLDSRESRLLAYDGTARILWRHLAEGGSPEQAPAALEDVLGLPPAFARARAGAILESWREEGLLGAWAGASKRQRTSRALGPATPYARWAAEWTCNVGGLSVAFAEENPKGAQILRSLFTHLEAPSGAVDTRFEVRHPHRYEGVLLNDGEEVLRTNDYGLIMGGVYQHLLQRLHPGIEWLALIHGGAAGLNGAGVGFPAASGSGKTTLVASLIADGFDYVADDLLAIAAPEGRVVPFPMPLSVKTGSWDVLASRHPGLASAPCYFTKGAEARLILPAREAWQAPPLPLRTLIFPRYAAGAPTELEPLAPFEALLRLLNDRIWLGHPLREERILAFLDWLQAVPAYALSYSDLAEAGAAVRSVLAP